jgi:hypothetical protein
MEIKKNKSPHLEPCKMNCDSGLHKKLNEYELSKFLNCHSTNMFVGAPGSGKTSLVVSLFKSSDVFYKVFHNIYLFQPSQSRASMKDNVFDNVSGTYDELTYENLEDVMNKLKEEDPKYCNCIIFDDMGAYLKNKEIKKLLKELIFNRRHLRTSIYFLCQTFMSVEADIRKLFSNLFVFRVSKKELEKIFEELVEQIKDNVMPISKLVYDKRYNFLFINTDSGRLFKNWDEILFS